MKCVNLVIIILMLVQLSPMNDLHLVARAENTAPTPTSVSATPTLAEATSTFVTSTIAGTNVASTAANQRAPQVQPQASDELGPVIFVPGIMGSYLDIDGCNIWPGLGQMEFNWNGSIKCDILPDKSILKLDGQNNKTVKATDAYRCTALWPLSSNYTTCNFDALNTAQYSKLLKTLIDNGYKEYISTSRDSNKNAFNAIERCEEATQKNIPLSDSNLYVLGYDWRQSTAASAEKLRDLVRCVYSRHNQKIALVGHSMGGLVIKQYLLNNNDSATNIKSVSTFNTPYLGAVRAIDIFGTGKYTGVTMLMQQMPLNFVCNSKITGGMQTCYAATAKELVNMKVCDTTNYLLCVSLPPKLRDMARTFPGAIELLPQSLYLQKFPCRLVINNDTTCNETTYWNRIAQEFGDAAKNYPLSVDVQRDDVGDIVERTKNIDYLIQFSPNKSTTVERVKKNSSNDWSNDIMGTGDGTVNEFSQTRYLPGDVDWNPKTTSTRRVFTVGFCNHGIDHTGIVSYSPALDNLILFLKNPAEFRKNEPHTTCYNGEVVQLAAPSLVSPAPNFVSTDGAWPELTWKNGDKEPTGLRGYRIQVSRNPDMSNPIVDECRATSVSGRSYKPTGQWWAHAEMGTYYWRVKYMTVDWNNNQDTCKALGLNRIWSEVRAFTNPIVEKRPQQIAPADRFTTDAGIWPSLTWAPAANVPTTNGYRIQVYDKLGSTKSFIVNECRTNPLYQASDPNWTKKYSGASPLYWRVTYAVKPWNKLDPLSCKNDIVEERLWSAERVFYNPAIPMQVVAVAPPHGTNTSDGGWPELQWRDGNIQTSYGYRIQVTNSSDVNFANPIVDQCTLTRTYKPDDQWWAQSSTGTFLWRVNYMQKQWYSGSTITEETKRKCRNISDGVNHLFWSVARTFINTPSSKAPQLINPAHLSQSADGMWAPLRWAPVASVSTQYGYRIQVSMDRNFQDNSKIVINECRMNAEYIAIPLEWTKGKTGTFHWRVNYAKKAWKQNDPLSCKNDLVTESLWSEVRTFTNQVPANRVVAVAPANGANSGDGGWPELQWRNGDYMQTSFGYRLQVTFTADPNFNNPVVDQCSLETTYKPKDQWWAQSKTGTFIWRVNYMRKAWYNGTITEDNKKTCKNVSDAVDNALWSETRSFVNTQSSKAPQLISPADGSQSADGMWADITWAPATNVPTTYGYRIQVSKDRNFQNVDQMTVNECRMEARYVAEPREWTKDKTGLFYWRVNYATKAWNVNDRLSCKKDNVTESLWSEPRSFRNEVPSNRVVLSQPATGLRTSNGRWPVLSWQAGSYMSAVYGYRIQVSKSENFSTFVVDECRKTTSYTSGNVGWESTHVGKLYWRINYVANQWTSADACKNQAVNNQTWSETRWFENAISTPTYTLTRTPVATPTASPRPTDASLTKPVLKSPSNGASGVSTVVELDWADVTKGNVSRYEVEICVETKGGSGNWKCAKYESQGPESRWQVKDRTGKIFPQRLIKWKVNANDGTLDGPDSDWWYFRPRYTTVSSMSKSSSKIKFSLNRESNDVTYQCKYNFEGYRSDGSWSSKGKASASGSSCEFSIDSMRSQGASNGKMVYLTITSDSDKTFGGFDGRENTDGGYVYSFRMP